MISLLACALGLQISSGELWFTDSNRIVAWASNGLATTWQGDFEVSLDAARQVPDGSSVGLWFHSQRLDIAEPSGSGIYGDGDFTNNHLVAAFSLGSMPHLDWSKAQDENSSHGEYRLKAVGNGWITCVFNDGRDRVQDSFRALKVGTFNQVSLNGTYKADNVTVGVSDDGGGRAPISGTLRFIDKSYKMVGRRVGTRARIDLISESEGTYVGYGWMEWRPSPKQMDDMRNGTWASADHALIWLYMANGSTSRTGMLKTAVLQ